MPWSWNLSPEPEPRSFTSRHEDLVRGCECHDTRGDVDADSGDVATAPLDLPRVYASAELDAEGVNAVSQRERAAHGARGTFECRQETISGEIRDATAVRFHLLA